MTLEPRPADSQADDVAAGILAGNARLAAKLITRIERGDTAITEALRDLYRAGGRSHVVGITGAPGCGKSTLVSRLLEAYRRRRKRVAVLAVDPSSPFTGGAILGDRVRMQRHSTDESIFIRSMSSRGALGGLAKAAGDAITVLDAMGWDAVIVETVGVGQNEIDIVRHASTVVVIETPLSGDAVQSVKAGVAEIGDVFVVNKADQDGADRRIRGIVDMLHNSPARQGWTVPVLKTDALSGDGIDSLMSAIASHREFIHAHSDARKDRMLQSLKHKMLWIAHDMMARRLKSGADSLIDESDVEDLLARRTDPYELARRLCEAGGRK